MSRKGKTAPPVVKALYVLPVVGSRLLWTTRFPTQKAPALRHPWLRPVAEGDGLAWASMPTLKGRPLKRPIVRSSKRRPTAAAALAAPLFCLKHPRPSQAREKRFGRREGVDRLARLSAATKQHRNGRGWKSHSGPLRAPVAVGAPPLHPKSEAAHRAAPGLTR